MSMRQGCLEIGISIGLMVVPVCSQAMTAESYFFKLHIPFVTVKTLGDKSEARGVHIVIVLPSVPPKSMQEKLQPTDELIRFLLGQQVVKELSWLDNGKSTVLSYAADDWNMSYDPVWRQKAQKELIELWGNQIFIDSRDCQIRQGIPGSEGFSLGSHEKNMILAAERIYGFLGTSILSPGTYDQFYDGRRGDSPHALAFALDHRAALSRSRVMQPRGTLADVHEADKGGSFADLIERASYNYGVNPEMIRAVISIRSGFDVKKRVGNCYGLMGIPNHAAKAHGVSVPDLYHPAVNVFLGTKLLAGFLHQFNGDVGRAFAAYFFGPTVVRKNKGVMDNREVHALLLEYLKISGGRGIRLENPGVYPKLDSVGTNNKQSLQERVYELSTAARAHSRVMLYEKHFSQIGKMFSIDPKLLEAMVMKENPWGDPSKRSDMGAVGLGQLMPKTAKRLGITDRSDPVQSLMGMARHLKYLLEKFKGNRVLAVAAYNCGDSRVVKAGNRVPDIQETRTYVRRIFRYYEVLTGETVDPEPLMAPVRPARRAQHS